MTVILHAYVGDRVTEAKLADAVIKFWRDIPSMVMIGRGRSAARAALPERFEQAIDRCAMKVGAKDDSAYLAEWRNQTRSDAVNEGETAQEACVRIASELEAAHDAERIKSLIANDGWSAPTA